MPGKDRRKAAGFPVGARGEWAKPVPFVMMAAVLLTACGCPKGVTVGDNKEIVPCCDEIIAEKVEDSGKETSQCLEKPPALKLTLVAGGFESPLFAVSPAGDPERLFVVEQTGAVKLIKNGVTLAQSFLDISGLAACCGERGLLGLAFHPDYLKNGRFWVNYTDKKGDTVVAEYRKKSGDPERAEPDAVKILFTVKQPYANHNGGMIAFGPDGYLYVGMGDGGSGGDPLGNGQNLQTKLGKILRVDVDKYPEPPPGNMKGGDPQIWSYGWRNPWRFSFDRATGDIYIADVGQNEWEEIDVQPAGSGGGNYGWNIMEGAHCYKPASGCATAGLVMPGDEYSHDDGCSVTGGYVYRGKKIQCLDGWYIYGDYCSNRIWTFRWTGSAIKDKTEITKDLDPEGDLDGISSFGEDSAGEVYVVSYGGAVYRIDPE